MKVLLAGGGGREDALAWALARSPELKLLRAAPGSAGISRHAECVPIETADVAGLARHAREERYDLVVVGPEAPLVAGLADALREQGIPVFGPSRAAARLEGSKVFAKEFLRRRGIPTAAYRIFDEPGEARRHLQSSAARYPLVVKADGLAAGKGVILADHPGEAVDAAEAMLSGAWFGGAGARIVVEDRLVGREVSFFVLADGEHCVPLAACQDYKRALDGDMGLNTGGMGSYSPSAYLDPQAFRDCFERIARPAVAGMAAEGHPYVGILYVGLMLTAEGPQVLEFNARFGDPETQVLMPRLAGDWLPLLHASATGGLGSARASFKSDAAVCVVLSAAGYPGPYDSGKVISGIEDAEKLENVHVFHAGTRRASGRWLTAGGRVLGVTALANDIGAARAKVYEAVARIGWEGEHHRRDIAADACTVRVPG